METFYKLFGSLLSFVYHCFDRMVILAYLPLLTREENIVHFFRDVNGIWPLTQEALRERTNRYRGWVDSYAADHGDSHRVGRKRRAQGGSRGSFPSADA